jgi:hypothetical protein
MLLKEFLELNCNGGLLGVFLTGTDGFDWFYKRDIPEALKNYKILHWRLDEAQEDLSITVEGKIFADGNE